MVDFIIVDLSVTFLAIILFWYFMVGRQLINKRRLIREVRERNRP